MIKVYLGNNVDRWLANDGAGIDPNRTLKSVLDENHIDYSKAPMTLDGATLRPGDLDKTFADFGITDTTFLLSIQKLDNA